MSAMAVKSTFLKKIVQLADGGRVPLGTAQSDEELDIFRVPLGWERVTTQMTERGSHGSLGKSDVATTNAALKVTTTNVVRPVFVCM